MTLRRTNAARIIVGLACVACASSQTVAPKPAFEVASIRVSDTTVADLIAGKPAGVQVQGARVTFGWMTMRMLVAQAYGVKPPLVITPEDRQNGPRFDIVAKMPDGSTREQYPKMLQALLAERFGLKTHQEQRDLVTTVMTVGKSGHKLKAEPDGTAKTLRTSINGSMSRVEVTDAWEVIRDKWMLGLNSPDTPFLDQTGLRGTFTGVIELVRTPELWSAPDQNGGYPELIRLMSIDAAERLGFKIENRKMPTEVVVVDHVNAQPTEN